MAGDYVQRVCTEASLIGLKEIYTTRQFWKLSWIFVFLAAVGVSIYQIVAVCQNFYENPVATEISNNVIDYDYEIPVLFCPRNWVDQAKVRSLELATPQTQDTGVDDVIEAATSYLWAKPQFIVREQNHSLTTEKMDKLMAAKNFSDVFDLLLAVAADSSDILSCFPYTWCLGVAPKVTSRGVCYPLRFSLFRTNQIVSEQSLSGDEAKDDQANLYTRPLKFLDPKGRWEMKTRLQREKKEEDVGDTQVPLKKSRGLEAADASASSLPLRYHKWDDQTAEFLFDEMFTEDVLFVGSGAEDFHPKDPISLAPGHLIQLRLKMSNYSKISRPNQPCNDASGYSQQMCRMNCQEINDCYNCTFKGMTVPTPGAPAANTTNFCNPALFGNQAARGCNPDCAQQAIITCQRFCAPPCQELKVEIERREMKIGNIGNVPYILEISIETIVIQFNEVSTITWDNFIGNIGGLLGLWLGLSITSIFQIFYIICGVVSPGTSMLFSKMKKGLTRNGKVPPST